MAYELDDGPKSYHVDLETLDTVSEDVTRYQGIEHIFLIVEDDLENLDNRTNAVQRHLGNQVTICSCPNTAVAQEELAKYQRASPDARLDSLLDFNMIQSEESKKSTEGLYFDSNFQHYLNNGGVVIFNTGYPSQVRQSMDIMDTQDKYENVLLLIAEKAKVDVDRICKMYKLATPNKIPRLREISKNFDHDLSKIYQALDQKRR
ncbi:hypothetical protein HOA91_01875 [Candidatus Woesearchaeota archaeon]|mgnify:FL=1|jgi:hypothetical protein|nr:hypothetical protein [Candidatus Woesearchaeota archaeon]